MLALDAGDVTPEPWVPHDSALYMTLNWDLKQTYHELVRLYDIFQGMGLGKPKCSNVFTSGWTSIWKKM